MTTEPLPASCPKCAASQAAIFTDSDGFLKRSDEPPGLPRTCYPHN